MEELDLKPGPAVGEALQKAGEFIVDYVAKNKKQPTRREVLNFLRK
jgi:hypothetical protein